VGFEWIAGESQKVFALPAYSGLQHSGSLFFSNVCIINIM